jgi:hypothetical protein
LMKIDGCVWAEAEDVAAVLTERAITAYFATNFIVTGDRGTVVRFGPRARALEGVGQVQS